MVAATATQPRPAAVATVTLIQDQRVGRLGPRMRQRNTWEMGSMGQQILVVDDAAAVREIVSACLEYAGYGVTRAGNGREALLQMNSLQPDLVLLDVQLPDLSGWDVLRLMRLSKVPRDIPVVMLTGQGDNASKAHAWQLGCACYLTKPIDLRDLLLVVRKLLASSRLQAGTSVLS
jgi:DNA-binding response OmpR family regulator